MKKLQLQICFAWLPCIFPYSKKCEIVKVKKKVWTIWESTASCGYQTPLSYFTGIHCFYNCKQLMALFLPFKKEIIMVTRCVFKETPYNVGKTTWTSMKSLCSPEIFCVAYDSQEYPLLMRNVAQHLHFFEHRLCMPCQWLPNKNDWQQIQSGPSLG